MSATPSVNGVFGQVYVAGVRYTCIGAPSFNAPLGTSLLPISGSAEGYLTSKGMVEPMVRVKFLARDLVGDSTLGNPLSDTFLGYVFGRGLLPAYNTTSIGGAQPSTATLNDLANAGVSFTDGASITYLYGAKVASWNMSGQKSGVVTVDVTFTGTGYWQFNIANLTSDTTLTRIRAMMPTTGECANPLYFTAFTFTEAYLAGKVFSFAMGFSNNLDPNRALDGMFTPAAQDAMSPSGTLTLTLQALDGSPGDHTEATGSTATLNVTNPDASKTVAFVMPNLKSTDPYSRSGSVGRILRSFSFLLAGDCNNLNNSAGRLIVPSASDY